MVHDIHLRSSRRLTADNRAGAATPASAGVWPKPGSERRLIDQVRALGIRVCRPVCSMCSATTSGP